jgi:hypothetical protein
MKTFSDPRFLVIYSGVVTIAFAVTLLCGFATTRNANFDILTVHRIDFVEPDDKLWQRVVLDAQLAQPNRRASSLGVCSPRVRDVGPSNTPTFWEGIPPFPFAFESDRRWISCRVPTCADRPASPRFPYRGSGYLHGRYPLV